VSSIPWASLSLDRLCPLVATSPHIVRQMLEVAQVGTEDTVYDLGCGDARILIAAVKEFGAKKAIGYETREDFYQAALWEIERQNLQDKITIIKKDLFKADISEASVITVYLSAEANEFLRPKFEKEAKCGTRIVSRGFIMNGWKPTNVIYPTGNSRSELPIYLYKIPESLK